MMNNTKKGNETSNLWPITCHPIMCKVFAGILAGQFMDIWKERNCCWMNRRAAEDRVVEPKIS